MASSSSFSFSSPIKMLRFVAGVAVFLTAMQFPGAASHPLAEPQQLKDSTYLASVPPTEQRGQEPTPVCNDTLPLTVTKTIYAASYHLISSSSLTTANAESSCSTSGYPNLLSSYSAILTPASTPTTPTVISTPSVLSIGATASPILQSIAPPLEPQPSGVVHTSLEYYPQVTTGNPWNRVRKCLTTPAVSILDSSRKRSARFIHLVGVSENYNLPTAFGPTNSSNLSADDAYQSHLLPPTLARADPTTVAL